jgi:UDP-glucose 4-epimerase
MRILLTGGAGFIGATIIERLLGRGDCVRGLDLASKNLLLDPTFQSDKRLEWVIGSVADEETVGKAAEGCDVIIHLAALLTPACAADPIRAAQVNVVGTLNMFEAARRHKLNGVLYMSSAAVYSPDGRDCPFPDTHYGAFKLATEGSARAYWTDHRISSVGLRPYIVYGMGREVGLTAGPALACRAAIEGRDYVIPFTGPADYVYVDDVASAFVQASAMIGNTLTGASVFDIPGEAAPVDEIVAVIQRLIPAARLSAAGPLLPIQLPEKLNDIRNTVPNVSQTSLADGLKKTIGRYRQIQSAR